MSDVEALAAEIRLHLTHHPDRLGWWHHDSTEANLPHGLAAALIAAGWRPPATRPLTPAELADFPPTHDPEAMKARGYRRLPDSSLMRNCWVKAEDGAA